MIRFKAVIIGCGRMAGGYDQGRNDGLIRTHAGGYGAHEDFEMVACVEPGPAPRGAFMRQWGIRTGYAQVSDVLDDGIAVDVASVCSPIEDHSEALDVLLHSDVRAVFCEKPLTHDIGLSRRIVAAYEAAGKPLIVNYSCRWAPRIGALRQAIVGQTFGRLCSARGLFSGGVVNNGSHLVDLVHFLGLDRDRVEISQSHTDYGVAELDMLFADARIRLYDNLHAMDDDHRGKNPRYSGHDCLLPYSTNRLSGRDDAMWGAIADIARGLTTGDWSHIPSTGRTALETHEVVHRMESQL